MNEPERRLLAPLSILDQTRTFRDVEPEAIKALLSASSIREISAGEALFRSGDPYEEQVFVLYLGEMLMRRPDGEQIRVQPGDFLGLANYLDKAPRVSTAVANTQACVLQVPADALRRLEQEHPSLFNAVNRIIAEKLRQRRPDRPIRTGCLAEPVGSVMKAPVATCGPEITLRDAFVLMRERCIGSTVVTDQENRLLGVLTFAGLAEAVLLKSSSPDDSIIHGACETARTITADTPLWKAEELQQRFGAKYLIVVEGETPVGMVSQTDILRALISHHVAVASLAAEAGTLKELLELYRRIVDVAAEAQESHRRPSAAVRFLSENHLAIQRRAVELSLDWMEAKGHGKPPVPFAVLIMGSGGRKEMLLNPDQDNALIIADGPESESQAVQEWFERFARRVNRNLDRVGYTICPGDIMARNPLYRKTLAQWKKQVSNVTKKPTDKAARWANVMLDFDTLYGDDNLTGELRRHVLAEIRERPRLLGQMAAHDAEGRPAIGFFNQLITTTKDEQGERIDIKRNGLRIVADAARIFALQAGVAAAGTVDRLSALVRVGKLSDDFATSVTEAFEELLDLLLTHQIRQAHSGKKMDKLIDPEKLSAQTRSSLRMAMRAVKRLQDRVQDEYGTEIF